MTTIDLMIIAIVVIGAVIGFTKGFMRQLVSIAGFIIGLLVACSLYAAVGDKLAPHLGTSPTIGHIFAFIIIWIGVPLALSVVAYLLSKMMKAISLGWLDSLLGAALGALKYALYISIFINILQVVDFNQNVISQAKKDESVLYYPTGKLVKIFFSLADKHLDNSENDAVVNDVETEHE